MEVKGIGNFLWPACLSGKAFSVLSNLMFEPLWVIFSLSPCYTGRAGVCPSSHGFASLVLAAEKAQQLRSSNKPLSLSSSYLNVWRSGIKYFLNVPCPSFPKVHFSPVMSWGVGFWHCSRSNIFEQHIEGSALRQGLCERNLYPSLCSTLWGFTGNSLRKQNFWSLVEVRV